MLTDNGKLLSMTKPTESSVYLSRDSECQKAKEAWETAVRELNALKGSGVSAGALSSAEEKVRNTKKAFDKAYAALMSVEKYTIPSSPAGTTSKVNLGKNNQISLR